MTDDIDIQRARAIAEAATHRSDEVGYVTGLLASALDALESARREVDRLRAQTAFLSTAARAGNPGISVLATLAEQCPDEPDPALSGVVVPNSMMEALSNDDSAETVPVLGVPRVGDDVPTPVSPGPGVFDVIAVTNYVDRTNYAERIAALEADLAAATRELERRRHGVTVEGDFVCPDSVTLTEVRADLAAERAAHAETTEDRDRLREDSAELFLAWQETGVAGTVRGLIDLPTWVKDTRQHFADARADRDHWKARAEALERVAAFARHVNECGIMTLVYPRGSSCTCGLDAARKAAGL